MSVDLFAGFSEYLKTFLAKYDHGEITGKEEVVVLRSDEMWKPIVEVEAHRKPLPKILAKTLEQDIDEQLKHLCLADRPMRAKLDISFRCGLRGAKVEVRVYTDPKGSA